ncbi:MAG: hypothetical protein WCF12_09690, partial [Propionicimonas sp.]
RTTVAWRGFSQRSSGLGGRMTRSDQERFADILHEIQRCQEGAVRPDASTGTKSIAKDEAYRVVPWLGTRLAGLF